MVVPVRLVLLHVSLVSHILNFAISASSKSRYAVPSRVDNDESRRNDRHVELTGTKTTSTGTMLVANAAFYCSDTTLAEGNPRREGPMLCAKVPFRAKHCELVGTSVLNRSVATMRHVPLCLHMTCANAACVRSKPFTRDLAPGSLRAQVSPSPI